MNNKLGFIIHLDSYTVINCYTINLQVLIYLQYQDYLLSFRDLILIEDQYKR